MNIEIEKISLRSVFLNKNARHSINHIFFQAPQIKITVSKHSLVNIWLVEGKTEHTGTLQAEMKLFGDNLCCDSSWH